MHCWSTYSRWTTFCKNKIKATSVSWSADDVLKHRPSSDDHLLFLSQYIKFWPSIKKRSLHSSFKTVPDVTGVPGSSAVVAPRILHFPDSGWFGKMQRLLVWRFFLLQTGFDYLGLLYLPDDSVTISVVGSVGGNDVIGGLSSSQLRGSWQSRRLNLKVSDPF